MSDFNRDKCLDATIKLGGEIEDKVAGTIYHYTDAEGFEGIIKSKEIWMTNALFVNDDTELRVSLESDIFEDVKFRNLDFAVFRHTQQQRESEDVADYYLASFSKDNDSIYQFRAYGGYCIGFDAQKLKKNGFNLFECVYKKEDIKNWIISKDKLPGWQDDCFNNDDGQSYKRTAFYILQYARQAKLKSEHYDLEEEIRLLVVSNSSWGSYTNSSEMFCGQPAIYFRKDNLFNVPVPYVKFFMPKKPKTRKELEEMVKGKSQIETKQIIKEMEIKQERELLPINEIRIGPVPYQEEKVLAIKMFLRENGYDKVDVTSSDIPFRGE